MDEIPFQPVIHPIVMQAIDTERTYQKMKWGADGVHDANHSVGDFILYMMDYHDEAVAQATAGQFFKSLHTLRKVAALGVACLEQHPRAPGEDKRERVYELLDEVNHEDLPTTPSHLKASNLMLHFSMLGAMLLDCRKRQARDQGDTPSIRSLRKTITFAMRMMRFFGAPLRQEIISEKNT